jgi:hypothetical protein
MFEINKKFTTEEIKEIETVILLKTVMNVCDAPATQEEFDKWCDNVIKEYHLNIQKENEKAEKKLNKANALGLTLEQYEDYQKAKRNYKRHLCEIKKAQEEIARLENEIKYHNRKANEWKRTMEDF